MKKTVALICVVSSFQANAISFHFTGNEKSIPDNQASGVFDRQNIITDIGSITDLNVSLEISGDFNGDLYALLVHESGAYSVLLNRTGRSSADVLGATGDGLAVTLDDQAASDIHLQRTGSGLLSGTFQPDAREADPDFVTDTSGRTAFLSSFNGINPNGYWTLYLADINSVGESRLEGWSLDFNSAITVPEDLSGWWVLFTFGILVALKKRGQPVSIQS